MKRKPDPQASDVASFRRMLLGSMMLVIAAISVAALYASNKDAATDAEREVRREFENEIAARHYVQEIHRAALVERCRTLVTKPRIHAALEDEAPDLLYPSARDELRDLVSTADTSEGGEAEGAVHADFYRFLDAKGRVIPAGSAPEAGLLTPEEESQLSLDRLPETHQVGYLARQAPDGTHSAEEVITMPILSQENGDVISAIVLGVRPEDPGSGRESPAIRSGFWIGHHLIIPKISPGVIEAISAQLERAPTNPETGEQILDLRIGDEPFHLLSKQLNPGSLFPPAFEVAIYPLSGLVVKQRQRMWQVLSAGAVLMFSGLAASHYISRRLSEPVERLSESRKELQHTLDELRSTEEELIQSEKMASLGVLTGGIMHELNNPLNFAKSALFVLERKAGRLPEPERSTLPEIVGDIKEGLDRISTILSDLRVFCSPEAVSDAPCALSDPLESSIRMLVGYIGEAHIKLSNEVPEDLNVQGDRNQLVLVFVNLIKNAIDAHVGQGPAPKGRRHLWITARANGRDVEIRFADDGPGIAPENLHKVFDPFFTTKPPGQGTGLGLSTSYRIVHAIGGTITVHNRPQGGAEFVVRLVRAPRPALPLHAPATNPVLVA